MADAFASGALQPRSTPIAPILAPCQHRQAQRVQRPRRKGVMVPEGTVYVGRPTMWGNPFANRQWGHARSCILHNRWIEGGIGALMLEHMGFCPGEIAALERLRIRVLTRLHQLSGKNLACWCPLTSQWCHADTLLRLAPVYADYERCSN